MKKSTWLFTAAVVLLAAVGCGQNKPTETPDAGNEEIPCVMNPMTHVEIINACTNAQAFDKSPNLPLRQPDGGLPPVP